MNELFTALLSQDRRELLTILLANTELSLSQIAFYAAPNLNVIKDNLSVLRRDGLVATRKEGDVLLYKVKHREKLQKLLGSAAQLAEVMQ
jgi:predicted transcriptional regulator